MKKIVMIFIVVIIILFISMCIMVNIDNKYFNGLKKEISENTDITDIVYVNKYNDHYIVKDNEYIYLFNSNYEEITRIKLSLLYDKKKKYDIVYRDKTIMYMDNFKNKEGIIYRYYDIYTYELIDEIVIGR